MTTALPQELSPETRGLLVFKRGHSQEVRRGRLPLAKLDYLQTLLVRSAAGVAAAAVRALGGALGGAVREGWHAATEAVAGASRPAGEQAGQQGADAAEDQEGGGAVAGSTNPETAPVVLELGTGKEEDGVAASRRQTGGTTRDGASVAVAVGDAGVHVPLGIETRVAEKAGEEEEDGAAAAAAAAAAAGDSFAVRTQQAADMLRAALVERGIPPRLAAAGVGQNRRATPWSLWPITGQWCTPCPTAPLHARAAGTPGYAARWSAPAPHTSLSPALPAVSYTLQGLYCFYLPPWLPAPPCRLQHHGCTL